MLPTAYVQSRLQVRSHVARQEVATAAIRIRPREIDVVLSGRTANAEGISQVHRRGLLVLSGLPSQLQPAVLAVKNHGRDGHPFRCLVGQRAFQQRQGAGRPIAYGGLRVIRVFIKT